MPDTIGRFGIKSIKIKTFSEGSPIITFIALTTLFISTGIFINSHN